MLLTVIITLLLVGADQALKYLVVQYLAPVDTIQLIPGVVGLKYVENTGAAFSIFTDMQPFLIIITGIALLAVAVVLLFRRPKGRLEYTALLLIFAGGIGNLIDRIANGYVVDYVNLLFINFAVFNLADTLVVVGFILFVIALFRSELKHRREKQGTEGTGEEAPGKAANGDDTPEAAVKATAPEQTDGDG